MSDFDRTVRAMSLQRPGGTFWAMCTALACLAAWAAWGLLARVWLYEITPDARIELDSATYPVASPVPGRVTRVNLYVGQAVKRGDVLIEIDSMPQQLQLQQARVESQGLEAQLAALHNQIQAEQGARTSERSSAGLSGGEAADRMRAAEQPARFAAEELARVRKLRDEKLVSVRDLEKAESEARRLQEEYTALQRAASRVPQEQAAHNRERDAQIARLQGEVAGLDAQHDTLAAEATRLAYEIERRRIRAPVDGTVGEAPSLRPGAVISEDDSLGSIVPAGRLRIVAQYPAQAALGRLHAGQQGTLRLSGFAWAEFGTVSARVLRVAQEAREGKVRVDLAIAAHSSFRGTLEHGMPGTLEVAVEQVSPLGLLMRTAGQSLASP